MNQDNNTCFASFGAHPSFEVSFERTVTELLQGRGLKDLDVFPEPSFDDEEVGDHHNLETHFIDSSGLISGICLSKKLTLSLFTGIFPAQQNKSLLVCLVCSIKKVPMFIFLTITI